MEWTPGILHKPNLLLHPRAEGLYRNEPGRGKPPPRWKTVFPGPSQFRLPPNRVMWPLAPELVEPKPTLVYLEKIV